MVPITKELVSSLLGMITRVCQGRIHVMDACKILKGFGFGDNEKGFGGR